MEAIFAKERSGRSIAVTVDPVRQNFSDVFGTTSFTWTPRDNHLSGKRNHAQVTPVALVPDSKTFSPFLDHENSLRMINRKFLSYCQEEDKPEYLGISTPRKKPAPSATATSGPPRYPRAGGGGGGGSSGRNYGHNNYPLREAKDFHHCAVLPVEPVLVVLREPLKFADFLERKAEEIMAEWNSKNEGVPRNERYSAERGWPLVEQSFVQGRVRYFTEYEMQIQTYLYTINAKKVDVPEPIRLRDCKARSRLCHGSRLQLNQSLFFHPQFMLKLRSTFEAGKVVDKSRLVDGFVYDQVGDVAYSRCCSLTMPV
jgi:hypothetical protein